MKKIDLVLLTLHACGGRPVACAQVHRPLTPDDACNATLLSSERRRTPLQVL